MELSDYYYLQFCLEFRLLISFFHCLFCFMALPLSLQFSLQALCLKTTNQLDLNSLFPLFLLFWLSSISIPQILSHLFAFLLDLSKREGEGWGNICIFIRKWYLNKDDNQSYLIDEFMCACACVSAGEEREREWEN